MGREAKPNTPPLSFGHLPQMQTRTEFGEEEYRVGLNILINAQLEIVLPLFLSRMVLRGTNGGR